MIWYLRAKIYEIMKANHNYRSQWHYVVLVAVPAVTKR